MPTPLEPVNDVHSGLNPASMRVHRPGSVAEVQDLVKRVGSLSLAGGRHAMGGQQFSQEGDLLGPDTLSFRMAGEGLFARVISMDHPATQADLRPMPGGVELFPIDLSGASRWKASNWPSRKAFWTARLRLSHDAF